MPYRQPAPFDPARALAWLCSARVVDDDGHVWSWNNAEHPGYRYPEAGGLLLSLLSRLDRGGPGPAEAIARQLLEHSERDEIGRSGTRYLFDEGIVLAGLLRHARTRGHLDSARLQPLYERFVNRLAARTVVDGPARPRWSTTAGPHLLKSALTIGAWPDVTDRDRSVLATLVSDIAPRSCDGRLVTGVDDRATYVHAHCYGVEGALRLAQPDLLPFEPRRDAQRIAATGAAWLARVQTGSGGIAAWHDGTRGWGPQPGDVAAQAIRIWALVDRTRYAANIDLATGFLARLTSPSGAVRYHGDSRDDNTWATVFAVQATAIARGGGDVAWLI